MMRWPSLVAAVGAAVLASTTTVSSWGKPMAVPEDVLESPQVPWHGMVRRQLIEVRQHLEVAQPEAVVGISLVGWLGRSRPKAVLVSESRRRGKNYYVNELWIHDLRGGPPIRLAEEPDAAILDVAPSPDEDRLAYVAVPNKIPNATAGTTFEDTFRQAKLCVVDVNGGRAVVATDGAQMPAWSAEGQELLFLAAVQKGWQPTRWARDGTISVASTQTFGPKPRRHSPSARFNADATKVAGSGNDGLTVVDLAAGTTRSYRHEFGIILVPRQIQWSPDSAWIFLQMAPVADLAVRLADGKMVELGKALGVMAQPAHGEAIVIVAAAWTPGPGHRLLVLAHRTVVEGDLVTLRAGVERIKERRWLVYDLDRQTTVEVRGIPLDDPGPGDPTERFVSPDGHHVGYQGRLNHLGRVN